MNSLRRGRDLPFYLLMVGPAVILFLAIIAWPVIQSIWLGFTNYSVSAEMRASLTGEDYSPDLIGFQHYLKIFGDDQFWLAFGNNMIVVAVSVLGEIPLGFLLAFLLYRRAVRGGSFFQAVVFLPNFISTVIVGIIWRILIGPDGPMTSLVQFINNDPTAHIDWLEHSGLAMLPISIALIWMYSGFFMVIFLANMQKLDSALVEAAQIDGATEPQIFFRIMVPLLWPLIVINAILAIAGSLKGFDLIWALAGSQGGVKMLNTMVLPVYLYNNAFSGSADPNNAMSYGSAISNVLVALSIILILLATTVGKRFNRGVEE